MDCSLAGSAVRGVAGVGHDLVSQPPPPVNCWCLRAQSLTRVQISVTLWTAACQAPLSMRFPRQECCSRLPFSSPGHLLNLGLEHTSPTLQADSVLTEPCEKTRYVVDTWYLNVSLISILIFTWKYVG